MTASINASTTAGLVLTSDTSGSLALQTAGTTAVTINTSQQVGIGTSSPSYLLQVTKSSNGDVISWNATSGKQGYLYADTNAVSIGDTSSVNGQNILFNTTNTYVATYTNGTEKMRVDGSGNLGLGVTPSAWNSAFKAIQVGAIGSLSYSSGYTFLSNNWYQDATGTDRYITSNWVTNYYQYNGGHYWRYAASGTAGAAIGSYTNAMTLDSSGNLLVGATTSPSSSVSGVRISNPINGAVICSSGSTTTSVNQIAFVNGNGTVGTINTNGSATAYNTSSDYRLKENVQNMTGALAKVNQLRPVTYDWIADKSQGQGFIAHELQVVVPDCVTGEKDAVDAEGKPIYQAIDVSFLVATLTSAIQELQAKLKTAGVAGF